MMRDDPKLADGNFTGDQSEVLATAQAVEERSLEEALEESFPASDPLPSFRFD